jgi:hypothetical protein
LVSQLAAHIRIHNQDIIFTALDMMALILTLTVAAQGNQVRAEIIPRVNAK